MLLMPKNTSFGVLYSKTFSIRLNKLNSVPLSKVIVLTLSLSSNSELIILSATRSAFLDLSLWIYL